MSVSASQFGTLGQAFLDATFSDFAGTIDLKELKRIPDGQGGHTESWQTIRGTVNGEYVLLNDVKCFCLPQSGSESFNNDRNDDRQMLYFHIRPIEGINEAMKLVYKSQDYQIRFIKNIANADQWLIIEAEKGVAI